MAQLSTALVAVLILTLSAETKAQQSRTSGLKEFIVTIEEIEDGFKLHSAKGSAWINLSFALTDDAPQAIDEYGMTKLGQVNLKTDPDLANYLFSITKTPDGIVLTGLAGTAWKELRFTLPDDGKQKINHLGTVD